MTQEEKAKRYDESLERAKKLQETCDSTAVVGWCEYIFPELKESKDVRIKKTLIAFFRDWERTKSHCWNVNVSAILAWLEKQGEKQGKSALEAWRDMRLEVYQQASGNRHEPNYSDDSTKMFSLNDIDEIIEKISEHKPTDKVEPKFNVGDWIISNDGTHTYLVKERKRGIYVLLDIGDGVEFNIVIETADKTGRLWSIYDAKDGDVLASELSGSIFLFRGIKDNKIDFYCDYDTELEWPDDRFDINDTDQHYGSVEESKDIHPATKKQRDLLFQKMADAGYEFVNGHITRF